MIISNTTTAATATATVVVPGDEPEPDDESVTGSAVLAGVGAMVAVIVMVGSRGGLGCVVDVDAGAKETVGETAGETVGATIEL